MSEILGAPLDTVSSGDELFITERGVFGVGRVIRSLDAKNLAAEKDQILWFQGSPQYRVNPIEGEETEVFLIPRETWIEHRSLIFLVPCESARCVGAGRWKRNFWCTKLMYTCQGVNRGQRSRYLDLKPVASGAEDGTGHQGHLR